LTCGIGTAILVYCPRRAALALRPVNVMFLTLNVGIGAGGSTTQPPEKDNYKKNKK